MKAPTVNPPQRRIAVMQPYFFPYAGYFRLLNYADYFVILDSVQFNRRGRVHRCQLPKHAGKIDWLTLPLRHHPQDVLICDLEFSENAQEMLNRRLTRYPWIASAKSANCERIREYLHSPLGSVIDFLEDGLRMVSDMLNLQPKFVRSSELDIPHQFRGQDRIVAIANALNGTEYVNLPGGSHLYDSATFCKAGLHLSFLTPYEGRYPFMLSALMQDDAEVIRKDILNTTKIQGR